jgi:hypothetical protein
VYDWLPHRKLEPHDDISDWLGDAEPERMGRILDAYARHGGSTKWPGERLLLSTASHELASIAERIQAVLGKRPVPRWLDLETADRRVGDHLDELPAKLERLTGLAKLLSDQSAGRIWTGRPGTRDRGCHSRG